MNNQNTVILGDDTNSDNIYSFNNNHTIIIDDFLMIALNKETSIKMFWYVLLALF